ncbi:MAG: phosphosulfolactate synthase [Limnochordia bacterium]
MTTKQEWRQVVPALISIPSKPRRNGLTMMIDKGLGMHSFAETLSMGAEYIDFIKLGFGTALLYPSGILEQKVRMAQERGIAIYPGGTLLEVAEMTETFEQFLDQAVAWGITHVEISDGTIPLSAARRVEMIRSAAKRGLRVITEIGKKTKNHPVDADFVLEQMTRDLDAGAEYVIMEARDSGTSVGIFDAEGKVKEPLFTTLLSKLADPARVIWEAPLVSQQQELLLRLGATVNLGNVQANDVITLAATRSGLRGDTLRSVVEKYYPAS